MNGRMVLILLLLSGSMPLVSALDASYEVMPHSGPSDQQILVWVRTEPLRDTNHYVADLQVVEQQGKRSCSLMCRMRSRLTASDTRTSIQVNMA